MFYSLYTRASNMNATSRFYIQLWAEQASSEQAFFIQGEQNDSGKLGVDKRLLVFHTKHKKTSKFQNRSFRQYMEFTKAIDEVEYSLRWICFTWSFMTYMILIAFFMQRIVPCRSLNCLAFSCLLPFLYAYMWCIGALELIHFLHFWLSRIRDTFLTLFPNKTKRAELKNTIHSIFLINCKMVTYEMNHSIILHLA